MSVLDFYAAHCAAGILASPRTQADAGPRAVAIHAYAVAIAMLEERSAVMLEERSAVINGTEQ